MTQEKTTEAKEIGRNEPCPCGSGKKYKRCHGVAAAPKLTAPKVPPMGMPGGFPAAMPGAEGAGAGGMGMGMGPGGFDPSQLDPQMMMQLSQALQRLPRGQMQRLQALMQKAMAGKDISREAAEFEKTLPVEFQTMLRGFQMMGGGAPAEAPVIETAPVAPMTEEEARALVAKAAAEGKISKDQAESLLTPAEAAIEAKAKTDAGEEPAQEAPAEGELPVEESEEKGGRFSKLWKGIRGK